MRILRRFFKRLTSWAATQQDDERLRAGLPVATPGSMVTLSNRIWPSYSNVEAFLTGMASSLHPIIGTLRPSFATEACAIDNGISTLARAMRVHSCERHGCSER